MLKGGAIAYTQTEKEVADYCKNNEFIFITVFDEFKERLDRENNYSTFTYYLDKNILVRNDYEG